MKEQPQSKKRCEALLRILLSNAVCPDRPVKGAEVGKATGRGALNAVWNVELLVVLSEILSYNGYIDKCARRFNR